MKRFFGASLLILLVIVVAVSCGGKYDPESDFRIRELEGGKTVEIVNYRGDNQFVRIPPKIQKMTVVSIAEDAFKNKELSNVTIPKTVTKIGPNAFTDNNLTRITIGANVELGEQNNIVSYRYKSSFPEAFDQFYSITYRKKAGTYVFETLKTKDEVLSILLASYSARFFVTPEVAKSVYQNERYSKEDMLKNIPHPSKMKQEDYPWLKGENWENVIKEVTEIREELLNASADEWAKYRKGLKDRIDEECEDYLDNPRPVWKLQK